MSGQLKEIALFGVSGVIGYVADVTVTVLLGPLLGVYLARLPAFLAAATTTWLVNRNVTFKHRKSRHQSLWGEYLHYLSLMIVGVIVNYVVYVVAITLLDGVPFSIYICVALGSIAGMTVNFVTSRRYVYADHRTD